MRFFTSRIIEKGLLGCFFAFLGLPLIGFSQGSISPSTQTSRTLASSSGTEEFCTVPLSASALQVVSSSCACSVRIIGIGTGKRFEFTGPAGYVFTNNYRYCQHDVPIFANDIKVAGVYTLVIYGSASDPRVLTTKSSIGSDAVTYTINVDCINCQK